jgi:hypothetical protein
MKKVSRKAGTRTAARKAGSSGRRTQLNMRIEPEMHQALLAIARHKRRSVPQAALHLLEAGLRQRAGVPWSNQDIPSQSVAALAAAGGAFDWLADEPDLYDDSNGKAP